MMRMLCDGITHGARITLHEQPQAGHTSCGIGFVQLIIEESREARDSQLRRVFVRCPPEAAGKMIWLTWSADIDCMACIAAGTQ